MNRMLPRWRTATLVIAAGLALATGLVGCSAGGNSSGASSAGDGAANRAAPAGPQGAGAVPNQNGGGAGGNPQAPGASTGKPGQLPGAGRSIVYTGSMSLRVSNVDAAAAQLEAMVAGVGGFVGGDDRTMDAGRSSATLVLRVPGEKFTGVVDDIGARLGGQELSRKVSTQDVTETIIDLDARIQSQQASVDRVRALLAKANSLSDITSIESQLTQREADLESLQAQKRNLDDLTALSSITVTLLGPEASKPTPKPKPEAEHGFRGGLKGGWHAFTAVVRVLLMVIGAVLPFAVPIGAVAALVLWLRRRRPARTPPPEAPVGSPAPVGPGGPAAPGTPAAPAAPAAPAQPLPKAPPLPPR